MLLVVKFKRGPCPATVEHIQTWRDGQKTFAQTIKLIIYYHSTAWNIFKLKPVCMLFHSHGFENKISYSIIWTTEWMHKKQNHYKISIQVFMQDSQMNKVEIGSSWQDVSLPLHLEESSALCSKHKRKTTVLTQNVLFDSNMLLQTFCNVWYSQNESL